jgi:hypothetical protein
VNWDKQWATKTYIGVSFIFFVNITKHIGGHNPPIATNQPNINNILTLNQKFHKQKKSVIILKLSSYIIGTW